MKQFIRVLSIALLLIVLLSCSATKTQKSHLETADNQIKQGNFAGAANTVEAVKDKNYTKKDRVLYWLDMGMLYHYAHEYQRSNEYLSQAEKGIEELYSKSVSRAVASMLLNDNVMEYSGEDYEDIYLNIFKAINYLELREIATEKNARADLFDKAFVEIRRIDEKLKGLEAKHKKMAKELKKSKEAKVEIKAAKNKFHNSVLARYLSMLMYRVEGNYDDARIDLQKISEAWKTQSHIYAHRQPDFKPMLKKTDKVRLNLMCFTGRAPDKKARTLYIHTEQDMLFFATSAEKKNYKRNLTSIDAIYWKGIEAGYHFKFQLPVMKNRDSKVKKIEVLVDGKKVQSPQLTENIQTVATETFKVKESLIFFKTIIRTVSKGLLTKSQTDKLNTGSELADTLLRWGVNAAVDATENADLRIARFFPAFVYTQEMLLSEGKHTLKINYYSSSGLLLFADDHGEIEIKADSINLRESFCLD
ncbi:MAG: hypothetical protein K8S56_05025 [Candidatus Cloacimonetes bacterium]|nr:hypothetical protein [Candidatus Cloacimonadota bacterium]